MSGRIRSTGATGQLSIGNQRFAPCGMQSAYLHGSTLEAQPGPELVPAPKFINWFQRMITMKWTGLYLLGYSILIIGILAALWKARVLASIGTGWTMIGVLIAIGIGIMIAVTHSGARENVEIDRK